MRRDNLRQSIGYVVKITDCDLLINLSEDFRGHVAGHPEGISTVGQPGDLIGIEGGINIIVARVKSIAFAEPKEIHPGKYKTQQKAEPLRQMTASVIGYLNRQKDKLLFTARSWLLPVLGASIFPLSDNEMNATVGSPDSDRTEIQLGVDSRNSLVPVSAVIDDILARHFAVLGSTGQGKTHFVAAFLQRLTAEREKARVVIFDVNGEYWKAFDKNSTLKIKRSLFGQVNQEKPDEDFTKMPIPYFSLGRHGLERLLLPSAKTQLPALRFAVDHLKFVEADAEGAKPTGCAENVLFDDCAPNGAEKAFEALNKIKQGNEKSKKWPHMKGLSCLAAEWYSIRPDKNGHKRDTFSYGHVHALITRINGLISDQRFTDIVDINGGESCLDNDLDLNKEGEKIVSEIFGSEKFGDNDWNIHIIDLSTVAHDLMPFILGSLLELYASELFVRGPGKTHPTLLVLEEAHHYLNQLPGDSETGQHSLAYERLAKEGRKFGLSLLISTQRPFEVSSTVLAQCGTLAVFRLTNDNDQRSIGSAAENISQHIIKQIPGLARGEAVVFGSAIPLACRIKVIEPSPEPDSADASFVKQWESDVAKF